MGTIVAHNTDTGKTRVKLPSGIKKLYSSRNRAMLGLVAGGGRIDKPMLKLAELTINSESRGTVGQKSEVSLKIQSNIHTEEETISISVNLQLLDETPVQVKRSVLSLPEEPVESEVPGLLTTKKKNKFFNFVQFLNLLFEKIIFRSKNFDLN